MHAHTLPAAQGWYWLQEGFRIWRRNPALVAFATFGYLLALLVISVFPFVGQLAASLLMPALSMGVLNACRSIDNGQKAGPEVLLSGFRSNVQALIAIGGFYLAASILVLLLMTWIDDGSLVGILQSGEIEDRHLDMGALRFTLISGALLSTPVMMAYWFAPMLAAWWQVPALKAMFFSFIACLRNWRPFLVYGLAISFFALSPVFVLGVLGAVSPALATIIALPLPLVLVPVLFASFYVNAREVFGLPGAGSTSRSPLPSASRAADDDEH